MLYLLIWILEECSGAGDQWKYGKYVSLQWKNIFYSENKENGYMHFIWAIFLNMSFTTICCKYW